MREYLPILIVAAIICTFTAAFLIAYFLLRKTLAEGEDRERHMEDSVIIRRLMGYARPYWKSFVGVFVIILFAISFDLITPLLLGHIQKIIKEDFEYSYLLSIVVVYALLLVVTLVSQYLQSMILQKTGQKILSQLRMDTFTHIEKLSHEQLNNMPVGKLVTRVTNDPNSISFLFTNILTGLLKNIIMVLGIFTAMVLVNYTLALMVLCFVPFVVVFTLIFRKFSRGAHRRVSNATTDINTYLSENLSGMKVTQIFNQEGSKMDDFLTRSKKLAKAKYNRMFVFGIFRPMVYMLYVSCTMCLFYMGCRSYLEGSSFLGQVIAGEVVVIFYTYISRFFNPIQALAEQFDMLQRSFAGAEKIFTILDMVPEVVNEPDAIELKEIKGEIEFKDVWFAYKPGEWVLKGVSFHVSPKQTVAFVGATGSGKTTILSLICRNYDIQKGQILIDGIDIKKIDIASLRRHFGQMLQDVFLFAGDIRNNIILRSDGITDQQVMDACRYVNADTFINRLENGLDEVVRERGNNFSAGQRQLLSFARTIIHKPSVMILDEATANIDTETEILIQDSLEKMKNIGTMLIVAHRLSTIQHADNIILLSHGQIVEQGNHQELLHLKGKYYDLYTLQYTKQQIQNG